MSGNISGIQEPPRDVPTPHDTFDFRKGTTTLGFTFNGGILIAVDSRVTMGSFVNSQHVQKVIVINDYLLGTMAGGAADCSFWERVLSQKVALYEMEHGERITSRAASKLLCNMIYQYKGRGFSMGTMIAGFEGDEPSLWYVDDRGNRLKGPMFSVGSGSTYAYGILDSEYRPDLTDEEAVELGRRAIYHATHRDAYSGGMINVYIVRKDQWEQFESKDCFELHHGYTEPELPAL